MRLCDLHPQYQGRYQRDRGLAPGYGERKRARDAAKIPLFAELPGMLPSAEEIERQVDAANRAWTARVRSQVAAGWLRVRAWLRAASVEQRAEFARRWKYLPHTEYYALDAVTQIERAKEAEACS